MPATRALHKDMANLVAYGIVSAAMETSTRTIIATYKCAIPHKRARVGVNGLFLQSIYFRRFWEFTVCVFLRLYEDEYRTSSPNIEKKLYKTKCS
jgi:hypothetical protein